MSKRVLSLAVAAACFLLAVQMIGADRAEIDAKISEAISYLGKEGDSAKKAFILVVDAVSLAAPGTTYSPKFAENIEKAKKIVETKSIVDPEGVGHLREAYRLIHSGKDFEMPSQISSIEDAVEYAKVRLAAAKKDFKAGRSDECVQKLVEFTVMVVTPMVKHQ
jgi:hypothetical protein